MKRQMWSNWMIILSMLLMVACRHEESHHTSHEVEMFPEALKVNQVKLQKIAHYDEVVGTIRAKTQSVLSSKIAGHIKQTHFEAGQFVKQGQLLIVIDDRDINAQLSQAQAAVQSAVSAQNEIENGIKLAKARNNQALSSLDLAQTTYKRYTELYEKQAVTAQDFDNVKMKLKLAQDEVKVAEQSVAQMYSKKAQVASNINQAQAGVREVQVMDSLSRITAPFDGLIVQKNADIGTLAAPGIPLLTIESQKQLQLEVDVRESDLSHKFRHGTPVTVKIDAFENGTLNGIVSEIIPTADPMSRTFKVKIALPPTPGLNSGMYGRALFHRGEHQGIYIPKQSLIKRGQLEQVFVIDTHSIAHLRLIKTGNISGDQIEVLSGLEGNERLLEPKPGLKDNVKVKVKEK